MIVIGEMSLWVALLMATWAATVSLAGGFLGRRDLTQSGERGVYAALVMIVLASAGLWTALFTHDFSIRYAASFSSANLPKVYTLTAFWAGPSGSLLFWALILAIYSAIAVYGNRARNRHQMPFVTGTLALVLIFFLSLLCFSENPFGRLDWVPPEGRGMNPDLQNPGMVIHPPSLYAGYVGTTIPFAFAIAALVTRRFDAEWLGAIRKWTLISWFFNTTGIFLGMWWAYIEPGWGGYWAWNPVVNASLLPWLVNTALLHSIIVEEKRGMLRKWNVTLVVAAFLLSIFGTFITRSGIVSSVHSFTQSSVGTWFAGFLVLAIFVTAFLVATRLKDLEGRASVESMVSREAAFLFGSVLLVAIAFSVLSALLFPLMYESLRRERIGVGREFFNAVIIPLGLMLLLLTGIGPAIAWRNASITHIGRQSAAPALGGIAVGFVLFLFGMRDVIAIITCSLSGFVAIAVVEEFYKGVGARRRMYGEAPVTAFARLVSRNRRRYGGYIIHSGILLVFAAFAGLRFGKDFELTLRDGEVGELVDPYGHRWRFASQGLSQYDLLNRQVTALALDLSRDGKTQGVLATEQRQYVDMRGAPTFGPSTEAGIRASWKQDVYVVLGRIIEGRVAQIRVKFNPLVRWVWMGGGLMALGGLIVMWPRAAPGKLPAAPAFTAGGWDES